METVFQGDDIPVLGDEMPVHLSDHVGVCLRGQWKVVFFPDHKALGLVSEVIVVIVAPNPHDRFGAEVALFNPAAGIVRRIKGDL